MGGPIPTSGYRSHQFTPSVPSYTHSTDTRTPVFAWYLHHSIPAIPINPSAPHVTVPGHQPSDIPTVPSLSALPSPRETSVSIITPPAVTREVLEEARRLGVPSVWLQPGTFDDAVLGEARRGEGADGFRSVVAGFGGGTRGGEGWCVLVDGEKGSREAGKL